MKKPLWLGVWLLVLCFGGSAVAFSSPPDFTRIVEAQGAAVVNISSTQAPLAGPSGWPGLPDLQGHEEWLELFRRFLPQLPEMPGGEEGRSLGSGFIVSADGYILTNAHVVADANEIVVRLSDKREFQAEVVGTDVRSDVAVIRIEAQGLPTVRLGEPERLKVGEWVLAIGSPFGFEQTATAGIVSAKGRALPDENFVPFIQTDVAINPGNSGGPLFNLRGEVVGINSQIYSETGGFMGLSFAIPIDVAMDVYEQLREDGRVRRGRIGVAVQEVTRALAESFGLKSSDGALISAVEPGGPAEQAGAQVGDVIVAFGGKTVTSSSSLPRIVSGYRPGEQVPMRVLREGKRLDLRVQVGEWLDDEERLPEPSLQPAPVPDRLGLVLKEPEAGEGRSESEAPQQGLIVETAQGAAARADLRPGDVILSVVADGRQTTLVSVAQFEKIVAGLKEGQVLTLLVDRLGGTSFVTLRAGG